VGRWQRYWFPDGGRINAGVARIAVAMSVLMMLGRVAAHASVASPADAPLGSYNPAGILMLLGDTPPPAIVITLAYIVAWLATLALLAGAWTRIAAAVSLVTSLVVLSWDVSFTAEWPHDNNLPLFALIAMQATRGGDVFGVDGILRRRRGEPPPPSNSYEFTPRLVQMICGLVFLSAFAFKIGHGRGFAWALSDNLRHQILLQFDLNRLPRTRLGDWLLQSVWRYRTAAVLNLMNQLLPIVACAMVNRPRIRAALGAAFAMEVLGIGLVMGLWDPHWMPLAVVFVDWDHFVGKRAVTGTPMAPTSRRRISAFIAAFLAYDIFVSFMHPRVDQRLRTYPFSAFPMFAVIRATKPYDQHRDYAFVHGRFHVLGAGARTDEAEAWLHGTYAYRKLYRLTDTDDLRHKLSLALADVRRRYPDVPITAVQLWACIYRVPAYPGPARLEPHDIGIMGEVDTDGAWTTAFTPAVADGESHLLAAPASLVPAGARLTATVDGDPTPLDLAYQRVGDNLRVTLPRGDVVLVALHTARPDGSPLTLLLARRTRKAWW
jgi:hypothetical protein